MEEKVKALKSLVKKYKAMAVSPVYNHIAKEKLDKVIADCDNTTQWISEQESRQKTMKKWDSPVFSSTELTIRTSSLTNECSKILSEPKPKPPDKKDKKKDKDKEKENTDKGPDEKESAQAGESSKEDDASVSPSPSKFRKWLKRLTILGCILLP